MLRRIEKIIIYPRRHILLTPSRAGSRHACRSVCSPAAPNDSLAVVCGCLTVVVPVWLANNHCRWLAVDCTGSLSRACSLTTMCWRLRWPDVHDVLAFARHWRLAFVMACGSSRCASICKTLLVRSRFAGVKDTGVRNAKSAGVVDVLAFLISIWASVESTRAFSGQKSHHQQQQWKVKG